MPRPFAVIGLTVFGVLAVLCSVSSETVIIALAFFTLCLILSLAFKTVRRQRVFPVAFASAAVACLLLTAVNEFYYSPQMSLTGKEHDLRLLITSECETEYGNYYCNAKSLSVDGEKASANFRLTFSSEPDIEPYDEIEGRFSVYPLGSSSDKIHLSHKSENRFLGAYNSSCEYSILSLGADNHSIGNLILRLRRGLKHSVMKMLPNDYGALAVAMLCGDSSGLSDEAYGNLRDCGITHIICVSGLHISLWSCAIIWLLRKLKIGDRLANALAIPGVVFFMLIAGMTYSAVRSGIMMILALISGIIFRKSDSLNSLGVALTAIFCVNPYAAGNVGLQLSALATLGIVLYSEYFIPVLGKLYKKSNIASSLSGLIETVCVTLTASAFTLPVTLTVFGKISLCVLPANILIIAAAEGCMITAFAGGIVALFTNGFNLPGLISGILAKYILGISGILSKAGLPDIVLKEKDIYVILCGIFILCALWVLMLYSGKKVLYQGIAVTTALFVAVSGFYIYSDRKITRVNVLDTGNGCSVLLSKNGKSVLVGCGGDTYNGAMTVSDALTGSGAKLEAVIIPADTKAESGFITSVSALKNAENFYCDFALPGVDASKISAVNDVIQIGDFTFDFAKAENKTEYCLVRTDDLKSAIIFDNNIDTAGIPADCDVVISRGDYPESLVLQGLKALVIQAGNSRGYELTQKLLQKNIPAFATAECGNLLIEADNGKISLSREN